MKRVPYQVSLAISLAVRGSHSLVYVVPPSHHARSKFKVVYPRDLALPGISLNQSSCTALHFRFLSLLKHVLIVGKEALNPGPRYSEVGFISVSVCGQTASTARILWHNYAAAVVSNRCTRKPTNAANAYTRVFPTVVRSVHLPSTFILLWLLPCMQAIVANGFIFLSGSTGTPNTTIEDQTSEVTALLLWSCQHRRLYAQHRNVCCHWTAWTADAC